MGVAGVTCVVFSNRKHKVYTKAIVCTDVKFDVLVSWHDLQALGIIPMDFPSCHAAQALDRLQAMFDTYPEV